MQALSESWRSEGSSIEFVLTMGALRVIWADEAYTSGFREWAEEERRWRVELPHHHDRQMWCYGLKEKPRGFGCDREDRSWKALHPFPHRSGLIKEQSVMRKMLSSSI